MYEEIIASIIGGIATIIAALIAALIAKGYFNRIKITRLEKKALKTLKNYYNRDSDAFVPVDDFVKLDLKLDFNTGDEILQRLRNKGLIVAFSHPSSEQNLIKLTSEGVIYSEKLK